ncbi:MAG: 50S ribosomal protein L24 [Candidatus Hodarchaeales archaeon]|jgi:large subunit ribosomal protein L24
MKLKYTRPSSNRRKYKQVPYHMRKKHFSVHLSRELRVKYGTRSLPVRKGDTVLITKGKYAGFQKKISQVSLKKRKVQIEGIKSTKTDGTEIFHYLEPSNLVLLSLGRIDDKRKKLIERKSSDSEVEITDIDDEPSTEEDEEMEV